MSGGHVALIVEDEPEMAAEVADLLRSFGHEHVHVENKADAIAQLAVGGFCYVLLDLQIKTDRNSIKPYVLAGMSLLEEIRRRFPRRGANDKHLLPVLVVSGHAKEHEDVVKAFQTGADAFIRKPLSSDGQDIERQISLALGQAGRNDHPMCANCRPEAENGVNAAVFCDEAFWRAQDYSEVRLHGEVFRFTGTIQIKAIRFLHAAALTDSPWRSGKDVLTAAESSDSAGKMGNLFSGHPCWGPLVESNRRGMYRLRIK